MSVTRLTLADPAQLAQPWLVGDGVDDWGRDQRCVDTVSVVARMRWNAHVDGDHRLPDSGAALLVANTRRGAQTSVYAALAIGDARGRAVRFVGRPDTGPLAALSRRLGGLLSHSADIEGALAAGELVVAVAHATRHPRHAGRVDPHLVGIARRRGVPVFPVATMTTPYSRRARIDIGKPVSITRRRRGPLGDVELADATQRQLQHMLDAMGGVHSGIGPVDWLARG